MDLKTTYMFWLLRKWQGVDSFNIMRSTNIKRCAHHYRSPKDRKQLTSDYKAKNQVPGIVLNAIHIFPLITLRMTPKAGTTVSF